MIDAQYRTLPDAAHTFDAGFSFGGIAAFYMGWGFDETFSRVGVQSVGTAGTFPYFSRIVDDPKPSTRFYFDSAGAGEPVVFAQALSYRDDLLSREQGPFVLERDLRYFAGELEGHVRTAAGSRLPEMLSFLYPASEETPECYDGVDNDGDGSIDYVPGARDNDPDCTSALDPSEEE